MGDVLATDGKPASTRRLIIALSGLPGTGKTTLGRALANLTGGKLLSFGDHVRTLAERAGRPLERSELQAIGDAAVAADPRSFVNDALAGLDNHWNVLILDGVRHVSVFEALKQFAGQHGVALRLIHLATSAEVRRNRLRERGVSRHDANTAERHPVEADGRQALSNLADLQVDASESPQHEVDFVMSRLGLRR
jgi:cytidylate kinase